MNEPDPAAGIVRRRARLLGTLTLLMGGVTALVPPVAQNPAYHHFADQRALLGVPNFLNVVSNLPFLLAGALGFWSLAGGRRAGRTDTFITPEERQPYWPFFTGVALTGVGSAYYHWRPDNTTLFWDRLPMTVAFMGLLASVIGERISRGAGRRALWPALDRRRGEHALLAPGRAAGRGAISGPTGWSSSAAWCWCR